jgi:sulfoxide reductase heme-binding subunit YedZ
MDLDLMLWIVARVTGLASFLMLAVSLLTGMALRSGVFDVVARNKALRSVHEFTAVLWIPLGLLHLITLVLDHTARIGALDLLVPFHVRYGTFAVGLGTITFEIFVLVAVTGWLKRWINGTAWRWVHRLSYVAFGLLFLHAVLAGTDFTDPKISAITWAAAMMVMLLSFARMMWGRLPE